VWRACQLFLLRHTAFRKGSSAGMPSALATTLREGKGENSRQKGSINYLSADQQ
jgi:hypothetical protein